MKLHNRQVTSSQPMEYLPMKAGVSYKVGCGVVLSSGVAELATGTTAPTHVCVTETTGVTGGFLQAFRVLKDMTFLCDLTADGTSLQIGDKVTIATDAINVTATKTDGVAEIVDFPAGTKTSGAPVLIKF
jgi:hypothetical protein